MLDNDTYLMISIFQKSAEVGESEPVEPEEYLDQYKDQIKAVGVLFEYLGLAKSKPKSPLGWKPTGLLVKFIAERVCNEGTKEEPVGNAFLVTLMMDAAFGSSDKDSRVLAQRLLHEIGLVRVDEDGEIEPTLQLQELFHDAYCDLFRGNYREQFFEIEEGD